MRIGFVIPTMYRGGAERAMSIICNELSRKGHTVVLMLTEDALDIHNKLDEKILVIDVSDGSASFIRKMPHHILNIKNVIEEYKIEIVVSFIVRANVCSIIASKMAGIPVVVSERNDPYTIPGNRFAKLLRDVVYNFADGFVFQTEYARDYFAKNIRKKSTIILNPVTDEIDSINLCNEKENTIISVSRLFPQKNLQMLIKAFDKIKILVPEYSLHIYGVGPEEEKLREMIETLHLGDRVFLDGMAYDVVQKVANAKVFALTSNFEGLSNALIEAMCVGTCCIATDSPTYGNRDLIENGVNGFIIPMNNSDCLAEVLLTAIKDEELNRNISRNALDLRNRVRSNVISDSWEMYLTDIYKNRGC